MPFRQHEQRGEKDAGDCAKYAKEKREWNVGLDAKHPPGYTGHKAPGDAPREAHTDGTANPSQPIPHGPSVPYGACEIGPRPRVTTNRSEERRVGKECRSRRSPYH